MGLHVEIRPNERFFVNGCEILNGDKRIKLTLSSGARFLKQSDYLDPAEVKTELDRTNYLIQESYLSGQSAPELLAQVLAGLRAAGVSASDMQEMRRLLQHGHLFVALKHVRSLARQQALAAASDHDLPEQRTGRGV